MDVGIPLHVFAGRKGLPYRLSTCGQRPGVVRAHGDLAYAVGAGLEALEEADTIVVPGYTPPLRAIPSEVLDALRAAYRRGTRIAALCVGAFALAEAGLLDGRRATTHWQNTTDLAHRYPSVRVSPKALYVDDGQILTSAGGAAAIDLCLHIVRRDLGVHTANAVARRIVAAPYRSGGQSQYVPRILSEPRSEAFAATREWALHRLHDPIGVTDLARHAQVSTRTFSRRFVEDTGYTPLQWLLRARVDLARELLEATELGVDQIAGRAGLGTAANLRLHFRRILGTSPTAYREAFTEAEPVLAESFSTVA